jgi:hypothetical protein
MDPEGGVDQMRLLVSCARRSLRRNAAVSLTYERGDDFPCDGFHKEDPTVVGLEHIRERAPTLGALQHFRGAKQAERDEVVAAWRVRKSEVLSHEEAWWMASHESGRSGDRERRI